VEIKVRRVGAATILDLSGPLLVGEAERHCRDRVKEQVEVGARKLVINLSGVPYMDSSGIGALVSIFNGVHELGGVCRFYGATRKGRQLLRMVRLDTVLELVEDEESALSSL
jgi:anti-sigma B factor antagonist